MKLFSKFFLKLKLKRIISLFEKGNISLVAGNYNKAIAIFTECIKINDEFYEAYTCRASAFFSTGKIDEALNDLESVIKLNPLEPEAYLDRAEYYLRNGMYRKSKSDLNKIIKIFEKNDILKLVKSCGFPYNSLDSATQDRLILQREKEFERIKLRSYELLHILEIGTQMRKSWNH